MSIRLPGTIVITRKGGKRGDFNVGELITEVGLFDVKDALIDEFEPGRYTGLFVINRIHPDSFTWRGRVFVKVRAVLDEILVDEAEEGAPVPEPTPEPDPIDTPQSSTQATPPGEPGAGPHAAPRRATAGSASTPAVKRPLPEVPPPAGGAEATAAGDASGAKSPDELLFGKEIFEWVGSRAAVKLDPVAVDREKFRAQRDRLKALGYGFDPKTQVWQAKAAAADIPF